LEEFTVDQNKGYVAPASKEASAAQLDEIERQARASVVSAKVETSRAESAEKDMAAKESPEAKLYGDTALDMFAPGLKMASVAVEGLDTRYSDTAGLDHKGSSADKPFGTAKNPITIEQDIKSVGRKPGAYRAPVGPTEVGVGSAGEQAIAKKSAPSGRKAPSAGEDLMARANIAETSLKDQGKDLLKSWDMPEKKLASVSEAKKLTFGMQHANEKALESVYVARQNHQATLGKVQQMAPNLGLASGPSINPNTLLREAEQNDSWKTGSSS